MQHFKVIPGDSYDVLDQFPDNFFDSVVTDSPYGLGDEPDALAVLTDWVNHGFHQVRTKGGFMGRSWDAFVPQPALWAKVFRVLKPGGYLLSFFGTRTYDWGAMAIRLAGFEIREQIAWTYGEGMPKGLDVARALDSHLGASRLDKTVVVPGNLFDAPEEKVAGKTWTVGGGSSLNMRTGEARLVFSADRDPASDHAKAWTGWNTSLKPAWEPIVVARKPLAGTVAENVLEYGTGALNVDACRVATNDDTTSAMGTDNDIFGKDKKVGKISGGPGVGRYPANIVHDGSQDVFDAFGGADKNPARFFYCAKATRQDRDEGLNGVKNPHATVKPVALMRWLCRLVTPPGGTILDPFTGSGSTGKGAVLEGFSFYGIELDEPMCGIATARVAEGLRLKNLADDLAAKQPTLFP